MARPRRTGHRPIYRNCSFCYVQFPAGGGEDCEKIQHYHSPPPATRVLPMSRKRRSHQVDMHSHLPSSNLSTTRLTIIPSCMALRPFRVPTVRTSTPATEVCFGPLGYRNVSLLYASGYSSMDSMGMGPTSYQEPLSYMSNQAREVTPYHPGWAYGPPTQGGPTASTPTTHAAWPFGQSDCP